MATCSNNRGQAHPVIVMTDQPLRQIRLKLDASGHLVKWLVEMSEFDITYRPGGATKAQGLAEFVAECTKSGEKTHEEQSAGDAEPIGFWLIKVDESCSKQGPGAGIMIHSPDGVEVSYVAKFEFQETNN